MGSISEKEGVQSAKREAITRLAEGQAWAAVEFVSPSLPFCIACSFGRPTNTWKLKQSISRFPWVEEKKKKNTRNLENILSQMKMKRTIR